MEQVRWNRSYATLLVCFQRLHFVLVYMYSCLVRRPSVFTGVWKRGLPCDDEAFLYMCVDMFGE